MPRIPQPARRRPATFRIGFTDQEHDDELGLINMQGRVYDPRIGRFLSADPFVASPLTSQGYSRYSYVLNSPLTLVDPSGFDENTRNQTYYRQIGCYSKHDYNGGTTTCISVRILSAATESPARSIGPTRRP